MKSEVFPLGTIDMYGIRAKVPRDPWPFLHRKYGRDCEHVAVVGGHRYDLRLPANSHLKSPAHVRASAP